MMLGLTIPLSILFTILILSGVTFLILDKNVVHFKSVVEARKLRQAHSRRKLVGIVAIVALPLMLALTIAPSLSSEDDLPNVSVLKPFSAECRYMSREGFLMYIARRDYGLILTRREARRIIKRQRKYGAPTYVPRKNRVDYDYTLNYKIERRKRHKKLNFDKSMIHVRSIFSHRGGNSSNIRKRRKHRGVAISKIRRAINSEERNHVGRNYDYYVPEVDIVKKRRRRKVSKHHSKKEGYLTGDDMLVLRNWYTTHPPTSTKELQY